MPTRVSDKGLRMIAGFEGCVLHPYNDVAGNATIGYGHLIHEGAATDADRAHFARFTEAQARLLLAGDLGDAERAVLRLVRPAFALQPRFDAIASFVFNVGAGAFAGSTLLLRLNSGRLRRGAADELPLWVHAGGVVVQGLVNRRAAERRCFLYGRYP